MVTQSGFSPKYIAVLALAAGFILGLGWLIRPREIASSPPPIPSEGELMQLARRAERRSLDGMASYFADVADDAASSIGYLPDSGVSGVFWNERTIVTSSIERRGRGTLSVQRAAAVEVAQLVVWGRRLPLAALASGIGLTPARRTASLPVTGSWVIAVWKSGAGHAFAPGSYVQSASATCFSVAVEEVVPSLMLTPMMSGGGLFDIDGNLVAVFLRCGDRVAAIATSSIDTILRDAATAEKRMRAQYGLVLGGLEDYEKDYFKTDSGVVVRELWVGERGGQIGLRAGDVIRELNGQPVTSPADLEVLTVSDVDQALSLTVQRGSQTLALALRPDGDGTPSDVHSTVGTGLILASVPPQSFRIDVVRPDSPAAEAGIQPGDTLVRIDHVEPNNLTQVQRVLGREVSSPVLLEVARGDHHLAVLVR